MRNVAVSVAGLLILCAGLLCAKEERPDLSGTWKLDASRTESDQGHQDLTLVIEDNSGKIHIRETRGTDPKDDVTEFTCGKKGKECKMQDGGDKASVSVYYNGPVLVTMKTHGRRGSSVEKRRYSLLPAGDALLVEVQPIDPTGKPEKLVFTKVP